MRNNNRECKKEYESTDPWIDLLGSIPENGCPPRKLTHYSYLLL